MPEQLKIGFIIALFLVVFFFYKKKKKRPTRLDLTSFIDDRVGDETKLPGIKKVTPEVVEDDDGLEKESVEKHIFFLFGKKYNAWNVLGVPMGGSFSEIKKAYAFKTQTDSENQSLYFKAYDVLIRK